MNKTLIETLTLLGEGGHYFCSEAHFQHELALKIAMSKKDFIVMPEFPTQTGFDDSKKDAYIDLVVKEKDLFIPIELKYKTKKEMLLIYGKEIYLKNQYAVDIFRYDFVRDIQRIEALVNNFENNMKEGYALFLTNESSYWKNPTWKWKDCCDSQFRLHEGSVIKGNIIWGKNASSGTTKGRPSFKLISQYSCAWNTYSSTPEFKYLLVKISRADNI